MRVLYVNHTSRVSGGELSLLGLLGALPEGIEAAVACPEGELAERLRERDVAVLPIRGTDGSLRLHPTRTPLALAEMAAAAAQVRGAAARFDADLVHANSIRAGLVATAPPRRARRPVLVHARDCLPPGPAASATLRAIARAELLVANSAYTRAALGPAAARAEVVHNAVDLSRFDDLPGRAEARAALGLGGAGPVLAVIAQLTPWKGQDDAIRIAAALRAEHPDLRLLLVGANKFDSASTRHDNLSYVEDLRAEVANQGLEDVVLFLGERRDIPQILAAVDLLFAPSWEEPFGRSIVEAMAAGVPVAATSVGGPPEIVDAGRTGLLLPPRDPARWASAIAPLLADPPRLATMSTAARESARTRFDITRHAAAIKALYARFDKPQLLGTLPSVGLPGSG